MSRPSKLEELGLLERAKELREAGQGYYEIRASLIKENPDKEKAIPSFMGIKRGLEILDRKEVDKQIQQGLNPVEEMNREFKVKMDNNTEELEKIQKKANEILDEAMESDSIADKTKALKEVRDTLAQISKNHLNLQQFYQMRINNLQKESFDQKEQVKKILVKWLMVVEENVCPICKERTIPKIMHLVEEEGE